MRTLVTGGAGFVGANLARHLAERGHDVAVLDDLSTGYRSNLDGVAATLHVGSILDIRLLAELVADADSIVHLAARGSVPRSVADPGQTNDVNTPCMLDVLRGARERAGASSSSLSGANLTQPMREGLIRDPMSPHVASELAARSSGPAFAQTCGLKAVAFRSVTVSRPLQSACR